MRKVEGIPARRDDPLVELRGAGSAPDALEQDPTDPLCSDIVTDMVVLTAANGDQLWLVNSGEDCLDLSVPGKTFIRGSGTFNVVGGTGRFDDATGSGSFSVVAEVTGSITGGVSGTFELHFDGAISPPAGN